MLGDIDKKPDHRLRRTARNQTQRRLIEIDAMLKRGVLGARDQGRTHAVGSRTRSCVYSAQVETAAHTAMPRGRPSPRHWQVNSAARGGSRRPSCTRTNAAATGNPQRPVQNDPCAEPDMRVVVTPGTSRDRPTTTSPAASAASPRETSGESSKPTDSRAPYACPGHHHAGVGHLRDLRGADSFGQGLTPSVQSATSDTSLGQDRQAPGWRGSSST